MSLLDELTSLDLTGIIQAKASISVAVTGPDLQVVLDGGAVRTALAGVGRGVEELQAAISDPAELVGSLTGPLSELAGSLDLTGVSIADYLAAVQDGATIVAGLVEGLSGDPATLGRLLHIPLEEALGSLTGTLDSFGRRAGEDLGRLRDLIDDVERGVPADPEGFARLAIRVLLPVPAANLETIRAGLDGLLAGIGGISLPIGRTSGLLVALHAVATAAASGDAPALARALAELRRVRAATVGQIETDLRAFRVAVERLRLGDALAPLASAAAVLRTGEQGLIEMLATWRAELAELRFRLETTGEAEVDALVTHFVSLIGSVEAAARAQVAGAVDARVRQAEEWMRSLLRHLRLRELRAEVSALFASVLFAVRGADLARPARELLARLTELRQSIEAPDLGAGVRAALEDAKAAIDAALDEIVAAVEVIGNQVEDLAGEAAGVLDRAAAALDTFKEVVAEVEAALDDLGIEQAGQQVVDQIQALREKVEEALGTVALPEPLRPQVERLIAQVEAIDLKELISTPVKTAVAELKLPEEVATAIPDVLQRVDETLQNLIPAELIVSIEAEIQAALGVIRGFEPESLLGEVTNFLDETAGFVDGLNPRFLIEEIRGPFQHVIDLIDRAHPRLLLEPVLTAYDDLLGAVDLPEPERAVEGTAAFAGGRGEAAARAVTEPIRRFVGDRADAEPTPGTPVAPAPIGEIRPGDAVRLVGSLPAQLRERLAELDDAAARAAMQALHALGGGLAADLRALPGELWALDVRLAEAFEAALAPLGIAQFEAGLAIHVNAGAIDGGASLDIVGSAAPDALRAELGATFAQVRGIVQDVARLTTTSADGAALQVAATFLERGPLAAIDTGLDGFLAAIDPEPVAAELDALAAVAMDRVSMFITDREVEIRALFDRFERLVVELNPVAQAQKFLRVLEVLREELDLLNPHRLVDELAEIHAAIRAELMAYDPAALVEEIGLALDQVGAQLRGLDPATLLGDLSFLDETVARVEAAVPAQALAGVGDSLGVVGDRLAAINPAGLLATIEGFGPRLSNQVDVVVEAVRRAIVALLEAIRFASANAGVSVSATVSVGGGTG